MHLNTNVSGVKTVLHSVLRERTVLRHREVKKSLNVLQWNAGGMSSAKKSELMKTLDEEKVDVFVVLEANINEVNKTYYEFTNYQMHFLHKSRQIASGILVGVRSGIRNDFTIIKQMNEQDKLEVMKLEVWICNQHFVIYGLYNPPNNKPNLDIINISSKTLIIGDFNAHFQLVGYEDINGAGKAVEEFISSNVIELIYSATDIPSYLHYNGRTTNPDLTLASTDIASDITRKIVIDPGSGHRMIISNIQIQNKAKPRTNTLPQSSWNFKKAKWHKYLEELEEKLNPCNFDFIKDGPDKNNKKLCNIIIEAAKRYIPKGRQFRYKPFWNETLTKLKTDRENARKKAESTGEQNDVVEWRKIAAKFKRTINESRRSAFNKFIENLDYRKDSGKVYKFIGKLDNKYTCKKQEPINISNTNNTLYTDQNIAKAFNKLYCQSKCIPKEFKKEEKSMKLLFRKASLDTSNRLFNDDFTSEELTQAISSLKDRKKPGPDNIMSEFLKHLGPVATETLLKLMNQIWKQHIPAIWKKSIIIPILKPGKSADNLHNYRPISLTSILAKAMEKMINFRLTWYLETENLLSENQQGFRKFRSTTDQILNLSHDVKDAFKNKKTTLALFVDFKGAYDNIWRVKLLEKLRNLNISGKMLRWICDFTQERLCATKINDTISKYNKTKKGVPQGAVTSPTLFNTFINDLSSYITTTEEVKTALYADDLVIWISLPNNKRDQLSVKMSQVINRLEEWSYENLMEINAQKTFYQVFSLCHSEPKVALKIGGEVIQQNEHPKYLGIYMDKKLNWQTHINKTAEKAKNRLNILKRLAGSKWGCSRTVLRNTYKTYIRPVLTYGSEALVTAAATNINKLEIVQNQALRIITGGVKSTPLVSMRILTGMEPIEISIQRLALLQYEKLIRIPNHNQWIEYKESCNINSRQLKTQISFIQKVEEIKLQYHLPEVAAEKFIFPLSPIFLPQLDYQLDITDNYKKCKTDPSIMRATAIETISRRYPEDQWLHIYTDGSLMEKEGNVGMGIYSKIFCFYQTLGPYHSNFEGEVEAIRIAVNQLNNFLHAFNKAVIFCDSKAAILAVANLQDPKTVQVKEIQEIIKSIQEKNKKIAIQWIPAHCGLDGNEKADFLAKKGTKIKQIGKTSMSYFAVKRLIRNIFQKELKQTNKISCEGKSWENLMDNCVIPDAPRREAVATFRLTTGHDCLAAHLHKISILPSPECVLCHKSGTIMNSQHLKLCSKLVDCNSDLTTLYWEARRRMTISQVPEH